MLGFEKTYTLPFKYEIPNYTSVFLEESSITKRWIKFIKRYIYLTIKRQTALEIRQILPKHRNILWINLSAPSLGDSLMDLSSRVLLKGKEVDLFTDKKTQIFIKMIPYFQEFSRKKLRLLNINTTWLFLIHLALEVLTLKLKYYR